jgi:alkylation response protein AidB-like acyl-CoA dehydrogenase
MDREGRLHPDAVAALRASGVARAAVPAERGGPQLNRMAQIELVEEFSRVDGAVGWCAMIAAAARYSCGSLQLAAAKRWLGPVDACLAGQLAPTGRAERVDDGFVVSDRFRFGSGISHATMVLAGCLVTQNGEIVRNERGRAPLFLSPHDGVPLGLARRGIDEVIALSAVKGVPPSGLSDPPKLRETVQVQEAVARAEVELGAARALCYDTVADLWNTLVSGDRVDARQRGMYRAAMSYAHEVARRVISSMFDVAATSAIARGGTLERLLRDIATACQRRVVHTRVYAPAGQLLLGLSSSDPTL